MNSSGEWPEIHQALSAMGTPELLCTYILVRKTFGRRRRQVRLTYACPPASRRPPTPRSHFGPLLQMQEELTHGKHPYDTKEFSHDPIAIYQLPLSDTNPDSTIRLFDYLTI